MRILIIGGTRFIGPAVARRLHDARHEVTVYHRGYAEGDLPKKVQHIHGERMRLADHHDAFVKLSPDVVVDMAAFTQQEAFTTVYAVRGVARRLVVISSQDVYRAYGRFQESEPGPLEYMPLTEDAPLRERFYPYRGDGRGMDFYDKILVERAAASSPLLPTTVLRLPMVYGERDEQHRLALELKRMDDARPAILLEERIANWRWSRAYVDNVAEAIALAVTDERAKGRTYNVGDAEALTYAEWVRLIGQAAGWGGNVVVAPNDSLPAALKPPQGNYRQHLVVSTARIRQELGYHEPVARDEALRRTIAWERETRPKELDQFLDYDAEDAALAQLRARGAATNAAPRPATLP